MRDLINEDFYLISEIADKMDIQLPDPTNKTQQQYGAEVITLLLKKAYKAKDPINKLLANLTDKQVEEVQKMPVKATVNSMMELFKKDGFLDFFK